MPAATRKTAKNRHTIVRLFLVAEDRLGTNAVPVAASSGRCAGNIWSLAVQSCAAGADSARGNARRAGVIGVDARSGASATSYDARLRLTIYYSRRYLIRGEIRDLVSGHL